MAKLKESITPDAVEPTAPDGDKLVDYLLKPDASDTESIDAEKKNGKPTAKSNVIDGLFNTKQATEAENQMAKEENSIPVKEKTKPEAEKQGKTERSSRPIKRLNDDKRPKGADKRTVSKKGTDKAEPPAPAEPEPPKDAPRYDTYEHIVYLKHDELFPFRDHPFQVRNDDAMKALVSSVKERGVDQPALVRPREDGGFEIVAGHRRQKASELAGYLNVPCVVRDMTDDEAVLAMTESNFNQRAEILPSERAKALKMQLDAIKHQGARKVEKGLELDSEMSKRSNETVADKNKMTVKQVQRYIALNKLTPDLLKMVDDKKIPFTPAVEMSYIRPENQRYIAVAIDAQQSAPSLAQAQRMRQLDQNSALNGDIIDGIMLQEKKEEIRVILNSQELKNYFGPEKSPREMKDQILKLLDEWKERQPELAKTIKMPEKEK